MDLTIKNLTKRDPTVNVHDNIPELPFNMCIFGKSSSGKTNVCLNLIGFYKKYFKNKVLIFTKSHNGSLYSLVKSIGAKVYNQLEDEDTGVNRIEKLLNFQKSQKEKGFPLKHILVLFDDFISDSVFSKKRSILDTLYAMARHYNISVITTTQQYTLLPSTIRRLSWYDIIFKISNNKEKQLMIYENCNSVNKTLQEFEKVFDTCTEEPYSFLFLNKIKGGYLKRFGM